MRKLLALALLLLVAPALAQTPGGVPATMASVTFGATTTQTKIISGITGQSIYLTNLTSHPTATSVVTLAYGTGTNCATGNTVFYGPATFQAGENVYDGTGYGAIFVVPSGKDVCITIATAAAPGWLSYAQY